MNVTYPTEVARWGARGRWRLLPRTGEAVDHAKRHVRHSRLVVIVFVVVIVGTLLQGLTIVPLAKVLELTRPEPPAPPLRLELAGFAPLDSAVVDVSIEDTAPAVGRALRDVPLPEEFVIAAIYRGDRLVTPRGSVRFMAGDHVFLITQGPGAKDVPEAFRGGTRSPASTDTA